MMILELHHIQLAMPEGREDDAREFYGAVLGLEEVDKPEQLRARGGVWFETGNVGIHLGVEEPFVAARKAHPALRVLSLADTITMLQARNIEFQRDIELP